MHYKGVLRTLAELEPGTPVEIVEENKFTVSLNTLADQRQEGIPVTGVFLGMTTDPMDLGLKRPKIGVVAMDGKWAIYSSDAGMDTTTKVFSELTGQIRNKVEMNFSNQIAKSIETVLQKHLLIKSGADPEIFVVQSDGTTLIPAWEFLGDKNHQTPFAGRYLKLRRYWDGFQAEFSMDNGLACFAYMCDDLRAGMLGILQDARNKNPGAKLTIQNVVQISPEEMLKATPPSVALGCDPSQNAYLLQGTPVVDARELPYRFAGGHIHFGNDSLAKTKNVEKFVKSLDKILGVASIGAFAGYEDPIRRRFYGLAGEYRRPTHGLEYRVLPNVWLGHPALAHFVFDLARAVIHLAYMGLDKAWMADEKEVIRVILESDVEGARKIIEKNQPMLEGILRWCFNTGWRQNTSPLATSQTYADAGIKLIMEGPDSVFKKLGDIEKNWSFGGDWRLHSENPNCQWHSASVAIKAGKKV